MMILGWLNLAVVVAVALGLLWVSPLAALLFALLLAALIALALRLMPAGGAGARLRRGLAARPAPRRARDVG
jgi:hypothetical protein